MTKEEMAKAYAEGFEDKNYREIAYAAFLCGFTAKCESSLPSNLDEVAEKYLDGIFGKGKHVDFYIQLFKAGAEWGAEHLKR